MSTANALNRMSWDDGGEWGLRGCGIAEDQARRARRRSSTAAAAGNSRAVVAGSGTMLLAWEISAAVVTASLIVSTRAGRVGYIRPSATSLTFPLKSPPIS